MKIKTMRCNDFLMIAVLVAYGGCGGGGGSSGGRARRGDRGRRGGKSSSG